MSDGRVLHVARAIVALTLLGAAACGGGQAAADNAQQSAAAAQPAVDAAMGEQLTPDPGGQVIEVRMLTDDQGNNRFDPSEFQVRRGDVIRYVLTSGVHNVNFLADSNAASAQLPPASQMLQLPGQSYDVKVLLPQGDHYFQCDPHAALGMLGRLKVVATR